MSSTTVTSPCVRGESRRERIIVLRDEGDGGAVDGPAVIPRSVQIGVRCAVINWGEKTATTR